MSLGAAIGITLAGGLPFLAVWPARRLAGCALALKLQKSWAAACFVTALRAWALAGVAVTWLAAGLHRKWFASDFATAVGIGLVVGVIAGGVFTPLMSVPGRFWQMIHDSLERAKAKASPTQKRAFNSLHKRLLDGKSHDRRDVLDRILRGSLESADHAAKGEKQARPAAAESARGKEKPKQDQVLQDANGETPAGGHGQRI